MHDQHLLWVLLIHSGVHFSMNIQSLILISNKQHVLMGV